MATPPANASGVWYGPPLTVEQGQTACRQDPAGDAEDAHGEPVTQPNLDLTSVCVTYGDSIDLELELAGDAQAAAATHTFAVFLDTNDHPRVTVSIDASAGSLTATSKQDGSGAQCTVPVAIDGAHLTAAGLASSCFSDPDRIELRLVHLTAWPPSGFVTDRITGDTPATCPSGPPPDLRAVDPSDWLGYVNAYRATSGLPPVIAHQPFSDGAHAHAHYLAANPHERHYPAVHSEQASHPGYTREGQLAAQRSVINWGTEPAASAIDSWMGTLLHGAPLLQPGLRSIGYGAAIRAHVLDTHGGRQHEVPDCVTLPVVWPGDGSTVPVTSFGAEVPNPLTACPPGYNGLAIKVLTDTFEPQVTAHRVSTGGDALEHCVITRSNSSVTPGGLVGIVPRDPLVPGRTYDIELTIDGVSKSWSFSVVEPRRYDLNLSCPAGRVPEDGFTDVPERNPHEPAIDCATWWDLATGTAPSTYTPQAPVTRGQMASFVARAVIAAGAALPSGPANMFPDDDGNPHETAINQLAAYGVVSGGADGRYRPNDPVTRAQMATYLVNAYERHSGGFAWVEPGDAFTDIAGSAHRDAINKAARSALAFGTSTGDYVPSQPVRRDQMASFLTRLLLLYVLGEHANLP